MKSTHLIFRTIRGTAGKIFRFVSYSVIGALFTLVFVAVWYLDSRPDLKVWHTTDLDTEYTHSSAIQTFQEYIALEDLLFDQLDERVYNSGDPTDKHQLNRYSRDSLAAPDRWKKN